MTGVAKRRQHFRADFSTAHAKTRANRHNEIGGLRSERRLHGAHGGWCGGLDGSPPPRVSGTHHTEATIAEQHRRAIRDAHGNRTGGIVGYDDIRLRPRP